MANDNLCVFCGQKSGSFRSTSVQCGNTYQYACRACAKELNELDELERCHRALVRGLAEHPERVREQIQIITEAESMRPSCPSCGGKLRFLPEQTLDSSPYYDGVLTTTFDVLPACCPDCGRYEFYNPAIVRKSRFLSHLILKDTTNQ